MYFCYSRIEIYLPLRATSYKSAQSQTSKLGALRYTVVGYSNTCRPTCTSFRLILIAFEIKSVLMKHVTDVQCIMLIMSGKDEGRAWLHKAIARTYTHARPP